jgi:hypothetical protein
MFRSRYLSGANYQDKTRPELKVCRRLPVQFSAEGTSRDKSTVRVDMLAKMPVQFYARLESETAPGFAGF